MGVVENVALNNPNISEAQAAETAEESQFNACCCFSARQGLDFLRHLGD